MGRVIIMTDKLVKSIISAIETSGGLFQRHPDHPEWDTTRPGAQPGEIAAFVRKVDERNDYISVIWHEAGEVDEDGYEWGKNCYEILYSHSDGSQARDVIESEGKAAEAIAKQMRRLSR